MTNYINLICPPTHNAIELVGCQLNVTGYYRNPVNDTDTLFADVLDPEPVPELPAELEEIFDLAFAEDTEQNNDDEWYGEAFAGDGHLG